MRCNFCYRECDIKEGESGYCKVRKNIKNKIVSINYGHIEALSIDPIEKKPLYHFLPGTKTLSIAQAGCNFRCDFCQNWQLSQYVKSKNYKYISPKQLISLAKKYNTPSISFTYSEPIVFQDYVIDCAKIAKENDIKTIMVTNGSFSKESREKIAPYIDAFNIDLKGDSEYYKKVCKGELNSVLDSIKYFSKNANHLEITTLIIETMHNETIINYLASKLSEYNVKVWHLSRFFPNYKMENTKETSEKYLYKMINVAKNNSIPFIYGGNTNKENPTICPNCKKILITNHNIDNKIEIEKNIINNRCKYCNSKIYGSFH